ncbi:hypothetical protein ACE38W_17635 [Chitinophaga sp. Hz27]|uniref:hypothetical protein n=1 Tax=Chitinophaga sp. Hz27 TaxID=3347169 RepID=UPI0035E147A8
MRNLLLTYLVILLFPLVGMAQEKIAPITKEDLAAMRLLYGKLDAFGKGLRKFNRMTPNGAVGDDCHPLIFSVVLEFKDSKILAPVFSKGASQAYIDFINSNLKSIEALPWETEIPGLKGLKDFRIFWMHCYVLDVLSSMRQPWSSVDMVQQMNNALSMVQQPGGSQLFIAPPYCIFVSETLVHRFPFPLDSQASSMPQKKSISDNLDKQDENKDAKHN